MGLLTTALLLEQATLFALIFLVTFIGGYVRDFVTSFAKTENKMRIYFGKIFVSALGISILAFFFGESLIISMGIKCFLGACFIGGMASYSVLPLFFTLEGLTKLARFFIEVKNGLIQGVENGFKDKETKDD